MIWEKLWLKWAAPEIPLALSNKIVAFYDLVHCFAIWIKLMCQHFSRAQG
jgi:hypothetical protein